MNNADKFKSAFGLYATEVWAMPEKEFIDWLNKEDDGHTIEQKQKGAKMDELISRAAVKDLIMETDPFWCEGMTRAIFEGVKRLPTTDAVPVVRCKDCKHYREGKVLSPQKFCFRLRGRNGEAIGYNFAEDDFCSYGERSEDETD